MRMMIVSTFLTLDGVMQAPGGPGEDDSGGFAFGGWSVNYWDDQMGQIMGDAMSTPFDLVLGRRTYDIFAAYWPHATDIAAAKPLNDATKYVASRSHPRLEWSKSVLIDGDAAEGVAALKKEDGPELQVHGSGNLIQTLMRNNLVDEYRLWVFPLVIGSGKRLFSDGTIPVGLKLVDEAACVTERPVNGKARAELLRPSGRVCRQADDSDARHQRVRPQVRLAHRPCTDDSDAQLAESVALAGDLATSRSTALRTV